MAGPNVVNITTATFQKDCVERSAQTPILLDFWAGWCEPCGVLGPVLEKLAEAEQELAQAFGVQGIPFCVLVRDGRPADGFQGALPEAEIREFLSRNGIEALAGAEDADEEVAVDPDSPEARLERARLAAAIGDAAATEDALAGIPEEDERYVVGQRLLGGLEWFSASLDAAGGGEPAAELLAARECFLARDYDGAMAAILRSATADRDFHQGLARRAMVLCFVVVGEEDERLDDFRRRLATLLY